MIYDEWFEGIIPNEWCPTALLTTTKVTAASAHVAFYLIDRSKLGAMDVALSQFERSLPVGVSLARLACDG